MAGAASSTTAEALYERFGVSTEGHHDSLRGLGLPPPVQPQPAPPQALRALGGPPLVGEGGLLAALGWTSVAWWHGSTMGRVAPCATT